MPTKPTRPAQQSPTSQEPSAFAMTLAQRNSNHAEIDQAVMRKAPNEICAPVIGFSPPALLADA